MRPLADSVQLSQRAHTNMAACTQHTTHPGLFINALCAQVCACVISGKIITTDAPQQLLAEANRNLITPV